MEKEKVGITTKNWILSIMGIIIFLCFIILPPVFRTFLKEEVKEEVINPNIPVVTTTCYKEQILGQNYIDNVTLTFTHQDNKLKYVNKKTNRTYQETLIYEQEKQTYGKLVTAFSIINGLDYTVTPEDNSSLILISENYDLSSFQASVIVIPGEDKTTEIKSDYQYNESFNTILSSLKNNGYVCK